MKNLPEIYVLRHGETEWNREGRWQGYLDSELTPKGQSQARSMGAVLAARDVTGDTHKGLSSPQGRAMRTAELALQPLGIASVAHDDLREIGIGEWTGLTLDEMRAGWPTVDVGDWMDVYSKAPGGEGFQALWDRAGRFLEGLKYPAVIVTHGITSRVLRTRAMGLGLADLRDLPGGQGVIHRISGGVHQTL